MSKSYAGLHHYQHINCRQNTKSTVVLGDIAEIYINKNQMIYDNIPGLFDETAHKLRRYIYRYNYATTVYNVFDENGETDFHAPWIAFFTGNFSIDRKSYEMVNGFDENFVDWGFENIDFGYRLYQSGLKFHLNKKALNVHIYHEQNRVINSDNANYIQKKHTDEKIINYLKFLHGEIPLWKISNDLKFCKNPDIYYDSKKIGQKYKFDSGV